MRDRLHTDISPLSSSRLIGNGHKSTPSLVHLSSYIQIKPTGGAYHYVQLMSLSRCAPASDATKKMFSGFPIGFQGVARPFFLRGEEYEIQHGLVAERGVVHNILLLFFLTEGRTVLRECEIRTSSPMFARPDNNNNKNNKRDLRSR